MILLRGCDVKMMSLKEIHDEYEAIMTGTYFSSHDRDIRLSKLMTIMERDYKIPSLRNIDWEEKNRKVIALYRKIWMSRSI